MQFNFQRHATELIHSKAISHVSKYNRTCISPMRRFLLNANVRGYLGLILFSDATWLQDSTKGGVGFIVTYFFVQVVVL